MIWFFVFCLCLLPGLRIIKANTLQPRALRPTGIHLPLERRLGGNRHHEKRGNGSTAIGLGDVLDV